MPPESYRARYVFPVSSPPIADGVVTIDEGRIVSVGTRRESSAPAPVDLGNVAIIPGLVNAHTHLEFSDLAHSLGEPGLPFPEWIRRVVAFRRSNPHRDAKAAVAQGLREAVATGTTSLGDINTLGTGSGEPASAPEGTSQTSGVVFHELIGLRRERVEPINALARELIASPSPLSGWTVGLSPHAPYTVHPEWLARVVEMAASALTPIAMHLAESREELQLLASGEGPFVELLKSVGAWDATAIPRGSRPLDYLHLLARAPRAIVVHGNYLDADEIAFVAQLRSRLTVVYCPRTHAYFGHARHPLPQLLAAGAAVAIGTDSRASNPNLKLFEELQFVADVFPELSLAAILELGTVNGARALGFDDRGTLSPGQRADLALVQLPDTASGDPHDLLFDAVSRACRWDTAPV